MKFEEKKNIRNQIKVIFDSLPSSEKNRWDQLINKNLQNLFQKLSKPGDSIGAFFPLDDEPCWGVKEIAENYTLFFPTQWKGSMQFFQTTQDVIENKHKWRYFLDQNLNEIEQRSDDFNFILVPGVAFHQKSKNRLGRGKGFYDKYLGEKINKTKLCKIGICYEAQLVDDLPSCDHDISMDYIVTEKEIYN